MWVLLIGAIVVMGIIEPVFFSTKILLNIIVQGTILGVITAAVANVIVLGEIDLSQVGIMSITAAIGCTLITKTTCPWPIAVIIMILIGTAFGWLNGILVAKLKAVSLITTLAMNTTLKGALQAILQGRSIVGMSESFKFLGQGKIGQVPVLPVVLIIVFVLVHILWKYTALGRSFFAVGGNASCAFVSGINVDRVRIMAFTISGLLGGLSGWLISSYLGAVAQSCGQQFEMNNIAAAVIGGVSLSGGRGKIFQVLGGVLLLTVIQVGLQMLGISSYYVDMANGLMIFAAVLIDAVRNRVVAARNA